MEPVVEMHAVFSGRVQGVGFRMTVYRHASQMGLKGNVCNLADGRVEAFVQGSKNLLDELIDTLKKQSRGAIVKSVDLEFYTPHRFFSDFEIH